MTAFEDVVPALDARFARLQRESRIPGVAWGVVRGGELAHAAGAGTIREGQQREPDGDAVFRIASMTKSFTATAILLLRDEGRLRLDDPAGDHVPALAAWRPRTTDSPPVTIRQLLTMSAGLATDDPWGDRQQGLPLDAFERLLEAGPPLTWPPDTTFEYSNLGYGILGRVVTNAGRQEYREFVRDRILVPLRMSSTAYRAEDVEESRLAHGYVRQDDRLVREGIDGYGALASMGGVFSSVRDLARWVAGFIDAFPARDDAEGPHPLRRSSRREMQQAHRLIPPVLPARSAHEAPVADVLAYGFGLVVHADTELGTVISHAGGYPGFGSHMAWHPATGLGVIGLGNLRYAQCRPVVAEQLRALVLADAVPRRRVTPSADVRAFRPVVDGLLAEWDDAAADAAFAMNMDLDEPRERRRAAIERVVADLGPFRPDGARPDESFSPAHLAWWLRGERGWVRVSILVTPEPRPLVQQLTVTAVHDPSPALRELAERVLAITAEPETAWPSDLAAGPDLDPIAVRRSLRAAGARFGSMRLGLPTAGDGVTTATFDVDVDDGKAVLAVTLEAETGAVTAVSLSAAEREAPAEAW
ncbi:MAG TPA: serine hydrolase domain-containing protein [Candidatus Limnocylindrales bacterium]